MRFFLDLAPWAFFALAFWITRDLMIATMVLIPATIVQVGLVWLVYKRVEKLYLVTLAAVVLFGGATLVFQEGRFIQWKPTVVNMLLAVAFLVSLVWKSGAPLPKRLLGEKVHLPDQVWLHLTCAWIGFFVLCAVLNLAVAYMYSMDVWVNFKLFGQLGLTLVFVLGQSVYIAKNLPKEALPKA